MAILSAKILVHIFQSIIKFFKQRHVIIFKSFFSMIFNCSIFWNLSFYYFYSQPPTFLIQKNEYFVPLFTIFAKQWRDLFFIHRTSFHSPKRYSRTSLWLISILRFSFFDSIVSALVSFWMKFEWMKRKLREIAVFMKLIVDIY